MDIKEFGELIKGLGIPMGEEEMRCVLQAHFAKLDRDFSQALDFEEFKKFYLRCLGTDQLRKKYAKQARHAAGKLMRAEHEGHARRVFKEFDKDGSGSVEAGELAMVVRKLLPDLKLKTDEWKSFVASVMESGDKDASGAFDFDEVRTALAVQSNATQLGHCTASLRVSAAQLKPRRFFLVLQFLPEVPCLARGNQSVRAEGSNAVCEREDDTSGGQNRAWCCLVWGKTQQCMMCRACASCMMVCCYVWARFCGITCLVGVSVCVCVCVWSPSPGIEEAPGSMHRRNHKSLHKK